MSYILDALKKAEQGRSQGKAPALFAVQTAEASVASSKSMLPWIVALVLILNGVAIFYWLRKSEPDKPSAKIAQPSVPAPSPSISSPLESNSPSVTPLAPGPTLKPTLPPINPPHPVAVTSSVASKKRELEKSVKIIEPHEIEAIATTTAASAPSAEGKQITPLTGLPPDIQQAIPKMVVGMHMYSGRPSNRLVTINDKPLHEGDELSPGLRLVEVMPDGMIFSYRGHRFKKGIN
ncbi:MAG: general secretion pathway protein GspB [Pseudomonadota bacterium]